VTDQWWWDEPDEPPSIYLSDVATTSGPGGLSLRITTTAQHVLLVVTGTKGSSASPPSSFNFYEDGALTIPVQPLAGYSRRLIGDMVTGSGTYAAYAYGYLVPTSAGEVYAREAGGVDMGINGQQIWGVHGLTEGSVILSDPQGPSTLESFFPVVGDETISSQWVFVAHTATGEAEITTISPSMFAPGEAAVPAMSFAGNEQASETAVVTVDDALDAPMILGAWWQLVAVPVPVPVIPPEPIEVLVSSRGTVDVVGDWTSLPPFHLTVGTSGRVVLPETSTEWRAVLVDKDGDRLAPMADAVIEDVTETINDLAEASVSIPMRSRAGVLIDQADILPELEVQIWRGDTLVLWGPIVDAVPEDDHWQLDVRDARWHLTRRHIGDLGGTFGGKPPYFHDELANPRFTTGDLAGWSILRTNLVGEFVGFLPPEPGAVRVDPSTRIAGGDAMVRCDGPPFEDNTYRIFQDLEIQGPQNDRQLRVTLSGWWFVPSWGDWAPNRLRQGLLLAVLNQDLDYPAGYYQPLDWSFEPLMDESVQRDQLVRREVSIVLPPGVRSLVHVAAVFGQGTSFVGGLELQVDDGLLFDESPSTMGPQLIEYAQMPEFHKSDVNLDAAWNTIYDRVVREYIFRDHTNISQAIQQLASEGWFDWGIAYQPDQRTAVFTAPRQGGYQPRARCRLDSDGHGNVARIERQRLWQSASTVVAAQTRSHGNHERAARRPGLTLEEIFVAPREPRDYDLLRLAAERLDTSASASVIEVTSNPGDERLMFLGLGDTTDLHSDVPGHHVRGRCRLVRRRIDPANDRAVLEWNPT
jgi:hypothetical protein